MVSKRKESCKTSVLTKGILVRFEAQGVITYSPSLDCFQPNQQQPEKKNRGERRGR